MRSTVAECLKAATDYCHGKPSFLFIYFADVVVSALVANIGMDTYQKHVFAELPVDVECEAEIHAMMLLHTLRLYGDSPIGFSGVETMDQWLEQAEQHYNASSKPIYERFYKHS